MCKFTYIAITALLLLATSSAQQCETWEVECPSGYCIPSVWICDGNPDCDDGWDELPPCLNTSTTTTGPCEGFLCGSGECIIAEWECDGLVDCADESDEHINCPCDGFRCEDGLCIYEGWICDGDDDCSEGEDEANCTALVQHAPKHKESFMKNRRVSKWRPNVLK